MMDEPFPFIPVFSVICGLMLCCTIIQSIGFRGFLVLMLICSLLLVIGIHEPKKKKKDEKK